MKKNIGTFDRVVRLLLAVAVGVAAYMSTSVVGQIILAVVALFTLYEALAGWCALYAVIGKNTCPIE